MLRIFVFLVVVWTATVSAQQDIAEQIERELRRDLEGWYPRCVDKERGGFHTKIGRDWTVLPYDTKGIVSQARMAWTAAEVAFRRAEWKDRFEPAARHGADFLRDKMWDAECGGFFWDIAADGSASKENDKMKHVYGQAFGIYALAAVYRLSKDERDLQLAKAAFHWIDRHGHDDRYGGYVEAFYRDGRPMIAPPQGNPALVKGMVGEPLGAKSMNSHIHLLEAFTALYHVWPDTVLRSRLEELLRIIRDKITTWPGAMRLFFKDDWTPAATFVSFGHDVETAFLLLEAIEALGRPDDPETLPVCKALVDHSLEFGWDRTDGGFFYEGATFGHPVDRSKAWWTQAEGLNALYIASRRFDDPGKEYAKRFVEQWSLIERKIADPKFGGWYSEAVEPGADPKNRGDKGHLWETPYHEVRAMLNVAEMLSSR